MSRRRASSSAAVQDMTTGQRVIAFVEEYCRVPEGRAVGQQIKLEPFQRRFITDVYDNPHGTSRAYLSMARKNGKTALIACLCLAHIAGPVAVQNSQIVSGARSRDQAALVFKLMVKMIGLEPRLQEVTRYVPSSKTIIGLRRNVEYRAISAEAKTAHGLSPVVAILDEVGQVEGPQDDFVDAVETSQGAHESPILFAISTQAARDTDLFSLWIDDARASNDPRIVCHVYEAPAGCDVMDESAWRAANPALGRFRSLDDMRKLAEKAARMPSFGPTFRNLNLNQRVDMVAPFVSREVWESCGAQPEPLRGRVCGGLDLSSVADLTALVLIDEDGNVACEFWLPEEGLRELAKESRAPYDVWADEGYLSTTPGPAIQYEYIARHLRHVFDAYDIDSIAFDRYNMRHLRPWLERAGFSDAEMDRFAEFGQGFASMSPALRELEARLLARKIRHGNHPVLTMCAANASVLRDAAGNRKLDKAKSRGRIDGMVALAMAVGVSPLSASDDEYDVSGEMVVL